MELPNPPWYRRWSVILAGVIVLAAVVALAGLRGLSEVATPETTVTAPTTTAPRTTLAPTATRPLETTVTSSDVLWTHTGKDVGKSKGFRAPSSWHIEWSFDCANFKKFGGGNFKITGDGDFERVDIQDFDIEASGSRTYRKGGYGHLLVDSVCRRWTVTAVAH